MMVVVSNNQALVSRWCCGCRFEKGSHRTVSCEHRSL